MSAYAPNKGISNTSTSQGKNARRGRANRAILYINAHAFRGGIIMHGGLLGIRKRGAWIVLGALLVGVCLPLARGDSFATMVAARSDEALVYIESLQPMVVNLPSLWGSTGVLVTAGAATSELPYFRHVAGDCLGHVASIKNNYDGCDAVWDQACYGVTTCALPQTPVFTQNFLSWKISSGAAPAGSTLVTAPTALITALAGVDVSNVGDYHTATHSSLVLMGLDVTDPLVFLPTQSYYFTVMNAGTSFHFTSEVADDAHCVQAFAHKDSALEHMMETALRVYASSESTWVTAVDAKSTELFTHLLSGSMCGMYIKWRMAVDATAFEIRNIFDSRGECGEKELKASQACHTAHSLSLIEDTHLHVGLPGDAYCTRGIQQLVKCLPHCMCKVSTAQGFYTDSLATYEANCVAFAGHVCFNATATYDSMCGIDAHAKSSTDITALGYVGIVFASVGGLACLVVGGYLIHKRMYGPPAVDPGGYEMGCPSCSEYGHPMQPLCHQPGYA